MLLLFKAQNSLFIEKQSFYIKTTVSMFLIMRQDNYAGMLQHVRACKHPSSQMLSEMFLL